MSNSLQNCNAKVADQKNIEHEHEHIHKPSHEHTHSHECEHNHSHAHEHEHTHKPSHEHTHSHECEHNHSHEHEHTHKPSHEHTHSHECEHNHSHAHEHEHTHKPSHEHTHSHECGHNHSHAHEHEHSHSHHHSHCGCSHAHCHSNGRSAKYKFSISAIFFILGLCFKFIAPSLNIYGISVFIPCFVASWFFAGYEVVLTPLKNFSKGIIFDENFLMSIATIGAFILGEWTEAASVMLFYNLGEMAQDAIVEKARGSITHLVDVSSSLVRVLKDEGDEKHFFDDSFYKEEEPSHVKIGSILLVKPGEKIPLDGVVVKGTSELNTSSMTGESLPRLVKEGGGVLAGFVNLTGVLVIKTTKILSETEVVKMLHLIEEASERKAKSERLITSFAKVYTPIVLILSLLISIVPPIFAYYFLNVPIKGFISFAPWLNRGLVFLVISCPCAFILSVPLAYFAGIGAFARNGILVKGADYIDSIAKAKKIVFDKTGTLTRGNMEVYSILPSKDVLDNDLLKYAFLGEANSNHPIAKAIKKYVENSNAHLLENIDNMKVDEYKEETGRGISCKVKMSPLFVGSKSFIEEHLKEKINAKEEYGTQVHVSYDSKYLGAILLQDEIKEDAKATIESLKMMGISDVEMLTGDEQFSAEKVASMLGIPSYKANLLPREKVEFFEKSSIAFKEKNKGATVMFMGDGINDAAVLSMADVGIASGSLASDAAVEASDMVFMTEDVSLLSKSIKLAKRTRRIVKENIFISFAIKLGFLILGSLGIAGLKIAVLGDVGVALLATLNAMRLRK